MKQYYTLVFDDNYSQISKKKIYRKPWRAVEDFKYDKKSTYNKVALCRVLSKEKEDLLKDENYEILTVVNLDNYDQTSCLFMNKVKNVLMGITSDYYYVMFYVEPAGKDFTYGAFSDFEDCLSYLELWKDNYPSNWIAGIIQTTEKPDNLGRYPEEIAAKIVPAVLCAYNEGMQQESDTFAQNICTLANRDVPDLHYLKVLKDKGKISKDQYHEIARTEKDDLRYKVYQDFGRCMMSKEED